MGQPMLVTAGRLTGALLVLLGVGMLTLSARLDRPTTPEPSGPVALEAPHLVWADEFEGAEGTPPDPARWDYDLGGNGWGNGELQSYTRRPENSALDGAGHLRVTARRERYSGADGVRRDFTSARLVTRDRYEFRYGRLEARVKLPRGQGLWPAAWMVGANMEDVGWPASGEIEVMESINGMTATLGSLKGPRRDGGYWATGDTKDVSSPLSEDFHVYRVDWTAEGITHYLDGEPFYTTRREDIPADGTWVFDRDFYLILNVAVGGWAGPPTESVPLPQSMLVDWIRVYQ